MTKGKVTKEKLYKRLAKEFEQKKWRIRKSTALRSPHS